MEKEFIEMFRQKASLQQHAALSTFRPLNRIIKHYEVKDAGYKSLKYDRHQAHAAGSGMKPSVKLNREGDIIKQIEVICGCGEKVSIDIEYD